jgi:hypothetical protein
MKLNTLFMINFILAILFGLGFTLMPATMSDFYGTALTPAGLYVGQLFGLSLIGFAVLTWLGRGLTDPASRQAIVTALFVSNSIGVVVSIVNQLAGVVNALGWSTVGIYVLLALGFGYFRFVKTE